MKGYRLSFLLCTILFAGALASSIIDKREAQALKKKYNGGFSASVPKDPFKENRSWVLFGGALIIGVYGYVEYRKADKKKT